MSNNFGILRAFLLIVVFGSMIGALLYTVQLVSATGQPLILQTIPTPSATATATPTVTWTPTLTLTPTTCSPLPCTPTPSPTPTFTATICPVGPCTATPTATATATACPLELCTATPTGTPTPTHTPTPCVPVECTPTPTPSPTFTATICPVGPCTATPTATPTSTLCPIEICTPTPTATWTPTPTLTTAVTVPTETPLPTVSPTATETPTPTLTATATDTIIPMPTPCSPAPCTATPTATPTFTATICPGGPCTATPTETPTATACPLEFCTVTPTATATSSPTPTSCLPDCTPTFTPCPLDACTATPTATPTATLCSINICTPTPTPLSTATATPTPTTLPPPVATNTPIVTPATTAPALRLRKSAPEVVAAGESITYTLQVTNTGSTAVDNLTVRDQVPTGATVVAVPDGSVVSLPSGGQQVEWSLAPLAAGQQATVRFVVTATQSLVNLNYSVQSANGAVILGDAPVLTLVGSTVTTGTVDSATGGTLTASDETLTVHFPPGAVTTPVSITMVNVAAPVVDGDFVGIAFSIEATDAGGNAVAHFQQSLVITISYSEADLQNAGITDEQSLNLYYWSGEQWVAILPCTGCQIDTVQNTITVTVDHLTLFAVRKAHRLLLPLVVR